MHMEVKSLDCRERFLERRFAKFLFGLPPDATARWRFGFPLPGNRKFYWSAEYLATYPQTGINLDGIPYRNFKNLHQGLFVEHVNQYTRNG